MDRWLQFPDDADGPRLEAAVACASTQADQARAHAELGTWIRQVGRPDFALLHLDRAVALDTRLAPAHLERGRALAELGRRAEALNSVREALTLQPDLPAAAGLQLTLRRELCDWRDDDAEVASIESHLQAGRPVCEPFTALSVSSCAGFQLLAAQLWSRDIVPLPSARPPEGGRSARLRIGYLSPDFRNHPVASMIRGVLARHDRAACEVIGISLTRHPDTTTDAIRAACDNWLDISRAPDAEALRAVRRLRLDIAVDLAGHTGDQRMVLFASRCAPVQINLFGYPGTCGNPWHDYIVADETVLPPAVREHYREQPMYLDCFQPNDADRSTLPQQPRATGLGFAYCCMNGTHKLTPDVFRCWMNILRRVPESTLTLYTTGAEAEHNLRASASRQGVDPRRLRFCRRAALHDYLATYANADLFLDTFPFNGGATASDALWAGVPVLTCTGEAFASRMAASLLARAGIPQLAVDNLDDYEDLAVELAQVPHKLAAFGHRLGPALRSTLYDTGAYVRQLEAAYARAVSVGSESC